MKPVAFSYHRAASLDEAYEWLNDHPDGKILAGGQSLIPLMNFRLSRPESLLDINGIPGLSSVERTDDAIHIGGLLRHQELHEHDVIRTTLPVLSEAAGHVGHWAIRNRGTLGGSLVHADPASELPATMVALDATFTLGSVNGERRVAAADFYLGFLTTDIEPNEILVRVEIPIVRGASYGFTEFARRPGDFALAGAIAQVFEDSTGSITWFGVSAGPERRTMSFAWDDRDRKAQFEAYIDEFELAEDGVYRKQLAIEAAEQAYSRAVGGVRIG